MFSPEISDISSTFINAEHGVSNAIDLLLIALSSKRFFYPNNSKIYELIRRDIPYCMHETSVKDTQILLNRNYKPIGSNLKNGEPLVNYDKVSNLHINLTKEQLLSISYNHSPQCIVYEFLPSDERLCTVLYLGALMELLCYITTDQAKVEEYKSDIRVRNAIGLRNRIVREK